VVKAIRFRQSPEGAAMNKIIALRPDIRVSRPVLPSKTIFKQRATIRRLAARYRELRSTRKAQSGGAR